MADTDYRQTGLNVEDDTNTYKSVHLYLFLFYLQISHANTVENSSYLPVSDYISAFDVNVGASNDVPALN